MPFSKTLAERKPTPAALHALPSTYPVPMSKSKQAVVFFVGGAGDKKSYYLMGPTRIVKEQVLDPFNALLKASLSADKLSRCTSCYLSYSDLKGARRLRKKVEAHIPDKASTSIYIVGHSLGGWNGAHLSQILTGKGYQVQMLITLDPVGEGRLVSLASKIYWRRPRPNAAFWINVAAKPHTRKMDDRVADFGQKWRVNALPVNVSHTSCTNHRMAGSMFFERLGTGASAADYLLTSIGAALG